MRRGLALVAAALAVACAGADEAARGEVVERNGARFEYGSVDVHGDASVVGARLAVPEGEPPPGGWPVVAYAHGTTGAADTCDPSSNPDLGGVGPALDVLAAAGYVAVATDYEGIGTDGGHPYLHGGSEAQAVVDSVLAARSIVPATSTRWAVIGHSQGGHAALFTAQRAAALAPELELVGAVAVAPAADPLALAGAGAPFAALLVLGWSVVDDDADVDVVLTPSGREAVERAEESCLFDAEQPIIDAGAEAPAFGAYLTENAAGQEPAAAPVLVVVGLADTLTPPAVARAAVDGLCGRGATVELREYPDDDHFTIVPASTPDVLAWLADRFAGAPAASTC